MIYLQHGKLAEAEMVLCKILALKPNDAQMQATLGMALRQKGDLTAALEAYRTAARFKPDSAEIRNLFGALLQPTGQREVPNRSSPKRSG
ncbi:MAG TPA: tetratricopeptide repeat protein [Blastocatellia bacterium]|nr:tetratricopeptide repeat protein [Blastocatellia bacterium]